MTTSSKVSECRGVCLSITPLPTPRPRFVNRGKFVSTYYPKPYQEYYTNLTALIQNQEIEQYKKPRLVRITAIFSIPKAKTSKLVTPTADIDNLVKGLLDSMQAAGVLENDSQVVDLKATKQFGEPSITFSIEEVCQSQ